MCNDFKNHKQKVAIKFCFLSVGHLYLNYSTPTHLNDTILLCRSMGSFPFPLQVRQNNGNYHVFEKVTSTREKQAWVETGSPMESIQTYTLSVVWDVHAFKHIHSSPHCKNNLHHKRLKLFKTISSRMAVVKTGSHARQHLLSSLEKPPIPSSTNSQFQI